MNSVKKSLLVMLLIAQSKPLLCEFEKPLNIFKKTYGLVTGLFLGSITGVTSAILDYNSGGKSAPVTWALGMYSRSELESMASGSNERLKSFSSNVGKWTSWLAYGAALLMLNYDGSNKRL